MIGMSVGDDDCVRPHGIELPEPSRAAVDHHLFAGMGDQQSGMLGVQRRARFNLYARADKLQFHRAASMGGVAVVNGLFRPNGVALLGILSLGHARFVGPSAANGFFAIFLFL